MTTIYSTGCMFVICKLLTRPPVLELFTGDVINKRNKEQVTKKKVNGTSGMFVWQGLTVEKNF